jgi:hypothetical protein
MSNLNLIDILEENTKGVMGIPAIIERYKLRVNDVLARTVNELSDTIELELPIITTAGGNYANSATVIPNDDTDHHANAAYNKSGDSITEVLKLINARLDDMESTIRSTPRGGTGRGFGGGGRGRGDGRGPGRGGASGRGRGPGSTTASSVPPNTDMYCFHHGTQRSHTGAQCHMMRRDPSFTQQMKNATAPCTIDGYEGQK